MRFSQAIVQGLWARGLKEEQAPYFQLPHVTSAEVAAMSGKNGNVGLKEYIRAKYDVFAAVRTKLPLPLISPFLSLALSFVWFHKTTLA